MEFRAGWRQPLPPPWRRARTGDAGRCSCCACCWRLLDSWHWPTYSADLYPMKTVIDCLDAWFYQTYLSQWTVGTILAAPQLETAARHFLMNCAAAQPRSLEGTLVLIPLPCIYFSSTSPFLFQFYSNFLPLSAISVLQIMYFVV